MTRSLRLTRRAELSLVEFARCGIKQAELYEDEVLARCQAILNGDEQSQSCAVLVDDEIELRFARAGEHFLVFLNRPEEAIIVEILNSRGDLPRHDAALAALRNADQ